jgi:hypothetical protein
MDRKDEEEAVWNQWKAKYKYEDIHLADEIGDKRWLRLFIDQTIHFIRPYLRLLPDEIIKDLPPLTPLTFSRGRSYLMLVIDLKPVHHPLSHVTIYIMDRSGRSRIAHYMGYSPLVDQIKSVSLPRLSTKQDDDSGPLPEF